MLHYFCNYCYCVLLICVFIDTFGLVFETNFDLELDIFHDKS